MHTLFLHLLAYSLRLLTVELRHCLNPLLKRSTVFCRETRTVNLEMFAKIKPSRNCEITDIY